MKVTDLIGWDDDFRPFKGLVEQILRPIQPLEGLKYYWKPRCEKGRTFLVSVRAPDSSESLDLSVEIYSSSWSIGIHNPFVDVVQEIWVNNRERKWPQDFYDHCKLFLGYVERFKEGIKALEPTLTAVRKRLNETGTKLTFAVFRNLIEKADKRYECWLIPDSSIVVVIRPIRKRAHFRCVSISRAGNCNPLKWFKPAFFDKALQKFLNNKNDDEDE